MFNNYPNFLETCTDKQVLACAYSIKEDKEEGNLTRAIETFGRTLVNQTLFGNRDCFYNRDINTLDENGNIDCVNCKDCHGCFDCKNCIGCVKCTNCKECYLCKDCTFCNYCKNCINGIMLHSCKNCVDCIELRDRVNCENCMSIRHDPFCTGHYEFDTSNEYNRKIILDILGYNRRIINKSP